MQGGAESLTSSNYLCRAINCDSVHDHFARHVNKLALTKPTDDFDVAELGHFDVEVASPAVGAFVKGTLPLGDHPPKKISAI